MPSSRPRDATPPLTTSTSVSPAGVEVLQHRRADVAGAGHVVGQRGVVEAMRVDMHALQLQPLRVADRDALGPQREHGVAALLGDAAVAQARRPRRAP